MYNGWFQSFYSFWFLIFFSFFFNSYLLDDCFFLLFLDDSLFNENSFFYSNSSYGK
jgi:hypothetical protein